ncbi:MAG: sulfatase-like hydrolase/transferase [Steroidobacteraceae bacterium]
MTDAQLASPWNIAGWALCTALFAASLPKRLAIWSAWAQLLVLPMTIGWVGAVVVSGAGPSVASTASITAGAFREVLTAGRLALDRPIFVLVVILSLASIIWAIRAVRTMPDALPRWATPITLCCMLALSITAMDAMGLHSLARLATPESKVSVPWLSHLEIFKEETNQLLSWLANGNTTSNQTSRTVSAAPHLFDMEPGLAVFMVGESLRADALIQPHRGPWSDELLKRLQSGLGVRLNDACSGGNATFVSVPRLLTAVDVSDEKGAAENPTILALAHAAGAKTAYINNHEVWVVPELGHDFMLKTSSMQINTYDEVAIDAMSEFVARTPARSKAVLVHFYGQHFNYEDRYPKNLFPPEPGGLSDDALFELRYARAAENGARVLVLAARVLDTQTEPAFLIFTSDHGENLPSDKTGKRLHAGAFVGRYDTTVPALVLWNAAFAAIGRAQQLAPLLKATGLIAHRDVANAWLQLAGMHDALTVTADPKTYGASGLASQTTNSIACSQLPP